MTQSGRESAAVGAGLESLSAQTTLLAGLKEQWRAYTMDEVLSMRDLDWLIQDLLPMCKTGVLYAKTMVGKSFLAASMAYSVLTGRDWHSKKVKQGGVVYVATEGAEGFKKRLRALRQRAGTPSEAPFSLVKRAVNLLDPEEVEQFIAYVKSLATPEHPVRLLVIDTLNRCMPGVPDENSNAAMRDAVAGAEHISDETGAFVLLVHHTGRNGQNARGGYAIECNPDALLRLGDANTPALVPGRIVTLYNEKQRDDGKDKPITLQAELEKLPDGSTSLVLVDGGKARMPRRDTAKRRDKVLALSRKGTPSVEIADKLGIPVGTVRSIISRSKSVATPATP